MGSKSDCPTMEIASQTLAEFGIENLAGRSSLKHCTICDIMVDGRNSGGISIFDNQSTNAIART